MGNAFVDLLNKQQDDGVRAALIALEKMGILRYDNVNRSWSTQGKHFAVETFTVEVNRILGRV